MSPSSRTAALTLGSLALVLAAPLPGQPQFQVAAEGRLFADSPSGLQRSAYETAVTLEAGFSRSWDDGRQSLRFEPYMRWGETDRIDLREASWGYAGDSWELQVGVRELFWGVSESQHLVDVINQRELIVGGPGYAKLGQPMVQLGALRSWGAVDFILLPGFRERSYSGRADLLWSPTPLDATRPVYESGAKRQHVDWAVRWSHTIGDWDLGLSHFAGTRREPRFVVEADESGRAALVPHYDVVDQTGLELSWIRGAWLWKLEAVTLNPESGRYLAAAGGLEYAFADYLSLFAEYLYDSRGDRATTSFGRDLFVGARLFLQDGKVEGGAFVDRETLNSTLSIAATRRLGDTATVTLEARTFLGDEALEPRLAPRQHRYLSLKLSRYF